MKSWHRIAEEFRRHGFLLDHDNGRTGMFGRYRDPKSSKMLNIQASWGDGWEHVSVSMPSRTPSWKDMQMVKDLFWPKEELAIQYHPASDCYVNYHPHCLHIWRPQDEDIPVPPTWMVGPISTQEN